MTKQLSDYIDQAIVDFETTANGVALIPNISLFSDNVKFYLRCREWANEVKSMKEMLVIRETCFGILANLPSNIVPGLSDNDTVRYGGCNIPFNQARALALQNYMTTCWGLYDSLLQPVGRIAFSNDIAINYGKYPRLPEHLLNNNQKAGANNTIGFRMVQLVQNNYGWPIAFSYCLRNWSVHEGHMLLNNLFKNDSPHITKPFEIKEEIIQCTKSKNHTNKITEDNSRLGSEDWADRDLIELLKNCEKEIDEIIGILLNWSSSSILLQTKLIFERDR